MMPQFASRIRLGAGASFVAALLLAMACSDTSPTTVKVDNTIATIAFSAPSYLVDLRGTYALSAEPRNAAGVAIENGPVITWTSSNTAIATVDASGTVRGVTLGGPVTITAASQGKTGTTTVTVTPGSIAFAPTISSLIVGTSVQLAATALDATFAPVSAGATTWTSTAPNIATVDSTGLVTAVGPGTFVVIASIAGKAGRDSALAGTPTPFDGAWAGASPFPPPSNSYFAVQFNVVFGTVSGFLLTGFPESTCATAAVAVAGNAPTTNSQFSLAGQGTVTITGTGTTTTVMGAVPITGTFASATTMTGAAMAGNAIFNLGLIACPNASAVMAVFSGPKSFTATKQ